MPEDMPGLRSLTAWLAQHARHVRSLSCLFGASPDIVAAVTSCLAVAGAAGQVEELTVEGSIGSTEWLAALRSLRHLALDDTQGGELCLSPAIGMLTALCSLKLSGDSASVAADARLPASITRLELVVGEGDMPAQARFSSVFWPCPYRCCLCCNAVAG